MILLSHKVAALDCSWPFPWLAYTNPRIPSDWGEACHAYDLWRLWWAP